MTDQPTNPVLPSGLVLPKGVQLIDPAALAAEPPVQGPPCARCGQPMPPLDEESVAFLTAHPEAVLAHEVCPGETPPEPEGRHFELRARIVELVDGDDEHVPMVEELIAFSVSMRGERLDAVMRPLAEKFGEQWMKAEKQANIADSDTVGIPTQPMAGS